MPRHIPFLIYLAGLSALSGWLMSHMSWIGRVGINFFHKEYRFLKVWYKGGGVVLGVLLLLFLLQYLAQRKLPARTSRSLHVVALLISVAGIAFTYSDFRTDFSHNILKERFHLGAYLFWIGWISISLYLLAMRRVITSRSEIKVERR